MSEYLDRMENELEELQGKISRLEAFLSTDIFEEMRYIDQHLLLEQHQAMARYEGYLTARLARAGR